MHPPASRLWCWLRPRQLAAVAPDVAARLARVARVVPVLAGGAYLSITNRSATRTLFLRPYLAHFCPVFSRFFAVFSVLTPGFQKVAPKDRGPVPQRPKTGAKRVVAAVL